jgi:hypothetical protein
VHRTDHLVSPGRGRNIVPGAFLRACLRWLASDPDEALAALRAHWPDTRPLGRPRREAEQDPGGSLGSLGLAQAPERADDQGSVRAADEDVPGAS